MSITKEVIDALHQRIKDLAVDSTPDQLAYLAKSLESISDKKAISNIVQMTTIKEIVDALHKRLKDLAVNSTPDQLAYLAKALESIVDKSAVSDIVQITDEKLVELLNSAKSHLNDLNTNKTTALAAISESEKQLLKRIDEKGVSSVALLDTRKDANIAAINSIGKEQLSALTGLVSNFKTINDVPNGSSIMKEMKTREDQLKTLTTKFNSINDVPSGSSIMKEVRNRNMVEPGSLPFLFGVLSRKNNYFGHGTFTTELGDWNIDAIRADNMLQLLAGAHEYDMNYVSFYRPRQLCFMEGRSGTFIYGESYVKVIDSNVENNNFIGKYPYAAIGSVFVKNTTNRDINKTVSFVGSAEGAGLFVGTPDNTNANKTRISEVKWVSVYRYAREEKVFAASGNVEIPAGRTVAIMLYTLSNVDSRTTINPVGAMIGALTGGSNHSILYNQFIQWGIYSFRSNFLTTGLAVDVERTLRAWQCPGLQNTYQIWN